MNYSQRKHLERLMSVPEQFDPLGLRPFGTFAGLNVIKSRDIPRYTLPEEVIPGVPWPTGFRDDINRWSRSFLGSTNMIPRGSAFMIAGGPLIMRPEDVVKISELF